MGKILNTDNPKGLNSLRIKNKRHEAHILLDEDEVKVLVDGREKHNLSDMQDTLVSGTNIKTVNGNSLLGSGDLDLNPNGTNYLMVYGTGTPTENAAELQAAYDEAKTMTPSISNRITIIVAPGVYTFGNNKLTLNERYIDVTSLTGNRDVIIDGITISSPSGNNSDIVIRGIDTLTNTINVINDEQDSIVKICNCKSASFTCSINVSGSQIIYEDCDGGNGSYNIPLDNYSDLPIICKRCIGGTLSFGGESAGLLMECYDCVGVDNCYGNSEGGCAGEYYRCSGRNNCFGGSDIGSNAENAKFYYCIAKQYSGFSDGQVHLFCIEDDLPVSNT